MGGLVGNNVNSYGSISNSDSTGNVSGVNNIDGLVGWNTGAISDSHSAGLVTTGANSIGGLVGYNASGIITSCYSTGAVASTGGITVGGLVGWLYNGTISYSYHTTGAVSGVAAEAAVWSGA